MKIDQLSIECIAFSRSVSKSSLISRKTKTEGDGKFLSRRRHAHDETNKKKEDHIGHAGFRWLLSAVLILSAIVNLTDVLLPAFALRELAFACNTLFFSSCFQGIFQYTTTQCIIILNFTVAKLT